MNKKRTIQDKKNKGKGKKKNKKGKKNKKDDAEGDEEKRKADAAKDLVKKAKKAIMLWYMLIVCLPLPVSGRCRCKLQNQVGCRVEAKSTEFVIILVYSVWCVKRYH